MYLANDTWDKILEIIKSELTTVGYKTWFSCISSVHITDDVIEFSVPNAFNKDILLTRYFTLLENAILLVCGKDYAVNIYVDGDEQPSKNLEFSLPSNTSIDKKYTFDSFVVGDSNRFAHAASLAVAEFPSKKYNPLFIYGGVGLGKTHLTFAIGNYIHQHNPSLKIFYARMDQFTDEFINSIRQGNTHEFKNKYQSVDVLIIDDIQFIMKKESTQEEFFHIFNSLYQSNNQIIITSDRPPKEIVTLEERLRSRFESGLICDIQAPDIETRIAIIEQKAQNENITLPDDIKMFIAEKVKSNIREIEGAIKRITALSEFSNREITLEMAEEVLKEFFSENKSKFITIEQIIKEVTRYFNLEPDELKSKQKTKDLANCRQIAMYLCRDLTENSLPKIGEEFGGRDHTTVIHALKKINNLIKIDLNLRTTINDLTSNIREK